MVALAGGFEQLRHMLYEVWYMFYKGDNGYNVYTHGTGWYL